MIEGQDNSDHGFFMSYKILARNKKNAVEVALEDPELDDLRRVAIEEISHLEERIPTGEVSRIIEKTGKAYFPLEPDEE